VAGHQKAAAKTSRFGCEDTKITILHVIEQRRVKNSLADVKTKRQRLEAESPRDNIAMSIFIHEIGQHISN
jgi:hypothetical protein